MPAAARDELDIAGTTPEGYEARAAEWGDYTVVFESFPPADPADLFKGLPDNRCQCHHFGYLFEGELVIRYADHDETIRAGQAYYIPPGHLPLVRETSRGVEFTRTTELQQTMQVVMGNLSSAQSSTVPPTETPSSD